MARNAVTIVEVPAFFTGANLTATTGSAEQSVDVTGRMPVFLLASNANVATVSFDILCASGPSTFKEAATKTQTVPAAAGGKEGKRVVALDAAAVAQSDGTIHIDSADPNIGDVELYAFTVAPTRL